MSKKKDTKYYPPKEEVVSNKIKAILASMGMSPKEFADICFAGNSSYVSRLINGKCPQVSLPIAFRISRTLKQPIEKIFICKPVPVVKE